MTDGKFQLIAAVFFIALGAVGHWAFSSLDFSRAREVVVEDANQIAAVDEDISAITDSLAELTENIENQAEAPAPVEAPATSSVHSALIAELQELITDEIYMKVGSRGTRVGAVQKFLNVFNKTNNAIDNDFGTGTKTKISAFQKSVGITADGEPGPQTYQKMIDWLNAN